MVAGDLRTDEVGGPGLGDPRPAGLVRSERVGPHPGADEPLRVGGGQGRLRGGVHAARRVNFLPGTPPGAYFLPMRRVSLPVHALDAYRSTGVSITRFGGVDQSTEGFGVDVATFAAWSRIGRHPAQQWQLLAVVSGAGWAAGPDGHAVPLVAGDAVLWEPGEEHASGSSGGMVAVLAQSLVPPLPHGDGS